MVAGGQLASRSKHISTAGSPTILILGTGVIACLEWGRELFALSLFAANEKEGRGGMAVLVVVMVKLPPPP